MAMLQNVSVDGFQWAKKTSTFNENLMKNYSEDFDGYLIGDIKNPEQIH